jgi:hypothetical protein
MAPNSVESSQATLQMNGSNRVIEDYSEFRGGHGAVLDEAGHYDLEATEELLAERFDPVHERLPDHVNGFTRLFVDKPYRAVYRLEGEPPFETRATMETRKVDIEIFPVGPHLNAWSVSIEQYHDGYADNDCGYSSWRHSHAMSKSDPREAVACALVIMRGEVPASHRKLTDA